MPSHDDLPAEVMEQNASANAIANLPPSLAILKLDNDNISSIAAARPRDMEQIKREVEITLKAFPELADEAIYQKPVGKVFDCRCLDCKSKFEQALARNQDGPQQQRCPRCDSKNTEQIGPVRQKFVRGLSIRSAEALAEAYGHNRVRADVVEIQGDDTRVKIEATFVDYQRGRIWQDSGFVSRFGKARGGGSYRIDDDRFYNLVVPAAKSKLIREVILRSVHPGLKAWFEGRCEVIGETLLDAEAVAKVCRAYQDEFEISIEDLETLIGKTRAQGWQNNDWKTLKGLITSLRTSEISVGTLRKDIEEIRAGVKPTIAGPSGSESGPAAAAGGVGPSDLLNPRGRTETRPETRPETLPPQNNPQGSIPGTEAGPVVPTESDVGAAIGAIEFADTVEEVRRAFREFQQKYGVAPGRLVAAATAREDEINAAAKPKKPKSDKAKAKGEADADELNRMIAEKRGTPAPAAAAGPRRHEGPFDASTDPIVQSFALAIVNASTETGIERIRDRIAKSDPTDKQAEELEMRISQKLDLLRQK